MIKKEYNHSLEAQNTFRMRVSCACYIEYDSVSDLESLDWDSLPKPVMSLGGGSNLLFTKDFPGTVLHSKIDYVKYIDMGLDDVFMVVGAGTPFDRFVRKACEAPYWGAENLSFIPGDTGAAAVQNVGAYGAEVKDIISGVVCFDTVTKAKLSFKVDQCEYAYRDSLFKRSGGRYIVTSVLFHLSRKPRPNLSYKALKEALPKASSPMEVREAVIEIRKSKLPDPEEIGSAGSFFKNPIISREHFENSIPDAPHYDLEDGRVKVPAAWLIDSCGFKGASEGGAAVYEKQPLVIINRTSEATPQDVLNLERRIVDTVKEEYGISLFPEVEHI